MPWKQKQVAEPVAPVYFDFMKAEAAFKIAGYEIQQSPFLVRKGRQLFRPLRDGEVQKFLRSFLIEQGQVNLFWRRDLAEDFVAFMKAGA
jgi:hypothetical protein